MNGAKTLRNHVIYLGICNLPDKNAQAHRAIAFSKIYAEIGKKPVIIGDSEEHTSSNILETRFEYDGIDCYTLPYPKGAKQWLARITSVKSIKKVINSYGTENIHTIIIAEYYAAIAWKLMSFCKKHGIKVIIDTVDWFSKSNYGFPKNIIKDLDTFVRMRILHKRAKNMITISTYLHDYYKKHVDNIVIVPSIIDDTSANYKKILPYLGNNVLSIAYVGNPGMDFEKERLDWAIEAVCKLSAEGYSINFIIAGVSRKDIEKYNPHLLSLPNFDECLRFMGRLKHQDALKLVASVDFSIIPRENILLNQAGLPTKMGESMCCGTPVIATPFGDVNMYIKNNKNGFVSEECSGKSVQDMLRFILDMNLSKKDLIEMHKYTRDTNEFSYLKYKDTFKKMI